MKKIFRRTLGIACLILLITSCKKEDEGPSDQPIDPADANALTGVVVMPNGTTTVNGSMPSPTGGLQAPQITSLISNVLTSNGSSAPFYYTYTNAIGNLGGFYVQIVGADSYFRIPFTGTSGTNGQIDVPIGLPTNVTEGDFCVLFSVYDLSGRISNQVTVCATVLRLGTGALQVSLSWNKATDQDLHVTDPSNTKIYYANKESATGGKLDRDDLDGFGPENIYWSSNAPDGQYKVQVHDYERSSSNNTCYVTVSAPGKSKAFTVTTRNGSIQDVVTITKSGTNYTF